MIYLNTLQELCKILQQHMYLGMYQFPPIRHRQHMLKQCNKSNLISVTVEYIVVKNRLKCYYIIINKCTIYPFCISIEPFLRDQAIVERLWESNRCSSNKRSYLSSVQEPGSKQIGILEQLLRIQLGP